jgi:hypothetical protein
VRDHADHVIELVAVFALLASMIAEAIASFFAPRASFLLRDLRSSFDGDASAAAVACLPGADRRGDPTIRTRYRAESG